MNTGKEAIQYFEELLKSITDDSNIDEMSQLQPITVLLLDINIPIVNGVDVIVRVKDLYEEANKELNKSLLKQDQKEHHILRPLTSYLSQYTFKYMK